MKKQELKKVLKPLIKECIKEVIFEEGVLSGLINEVVTGLSVQPTLVEAQQEAPATPDFSRRNVQLQEEMRRELETRKQRLEQSMGSGFEGIFENVDPLRNSAAQSGEPSPGSPLGTYAPNDAGVDISGIMAVATGGKPWKPIT